MEEQKTEKQSSDNAGSGKFDFNTEKERVIRTVKAVIVDPIGFFRSMPKTGGYKEPALFVAVMMAVAAVVNMVLSVFGLGMGAVSPIHWVSLFSCR